MTFGRTSASAILSSFLLVASSTVAVGCSSSADPAASDKSPQDAGTGGSTTDPDAGGCTATVPASCPSPEPSWSNQIEPLIEAHCWTCHANGGVEASAFPLATYPDVYSLRTGALDLLSSCAMPPANAPASADLDEADRETLLGWFVCGAPNN